MPVLGSTRPQQVGSVTAVFGWFVVTGPDFEVACLRAPPDAGTALGLVTGVMRPLLSCLKRAMGRSVSILRTKNEVQICGLQLRYIISLVFI